MNQQVADHGIGLEGDQRLTLTLTPATKGQEYGADGVFAMGHTPRGSAQCDPWRNRQTSVQTVKPGRKMADWTIGFGSVQSGLKSFSVVCGTVAFGAILAGINLTYT
jgi:hypothetical protein